MKQGLLFPVPRNFHLLYLAGRPVGAMSLREYCIKRTLDELEGNDHLIWDVGENWKPEFVKVYFAEIWKEYLSRQKGLMKSFKNGDSPNRPVWMKQRAHYKKFLKAVHNGEALEVYYANK